jgi:hypothetical protein
LDDDEDGASSILSTDGAMELSSEFVPLPPRASSSDDSRAEDGGDGEDGASSSWPSSAAGPSIRL